jgi:DedD protein
VKDGSVQLSCQPRAAIVLKQADYMMSDQSVGTEEQRLKGRPMRRLVLALCLIALVIVALALFDRYASTPKLMATPASPPVEPPVIATLPKPIQPAPETIQHEGTQSINRLPPPPPPSVSNEPLAPGESAGPLKLAQSPANAAAKIVPESTSGIVPESTGGTSRAAAKTAPKASAEPPAPPAVSKMAPGAAGFVVQLGVFQSVEHAQSLQAKLKEQGIPTTLETRVIIGPFQDRAEADATQRKLKALGVSGLVAQRK